MKLIIQSAHRHSRLYFHNQGLGRQLGGSLHIYYSSPTPLPDGSVGLVPGVMLLPKLSQVYLNPERSGGLENLWWHYPRFFQEQTPPPAPSPDGGCPILYSQTSWHWFMQPLPSENFPGVRSSFFAICIEYSALGWHLLSEASSVILILCCAVA